MLSPTMPKEAEHGSLTALGEKLVRIGAKMVSHGCAFTGRRGEEAMRGPAPKNSAVDR